MPFFCFLSAKVYSGKWPGQVVIYHMFKSIFYNDLGAFRQESAKETVSGSEYNYDYDPKFGEARITISDLSGTIFVIIKRTTSCNLIMLVKDLQDNHSYNIDVDNWIFINTESEMLDWMIQKYPQIAERMIWSLDGE